MLDLHMTTNSVSFISSTVLLRHYHNTALDILFTKDLTPNCNSALTISLNSVLREEKLSYILANLIFS